MTRRESPSPAQEQAEAFNRFLAYPLSHFKIWEKHYASRYGVDFDYYPRGRVVYRKTDETYLIYCDRCIRKEVRQLLAQYPGRKVLFGFDEHYQCHDCNPDYVV